MVAVLPILGCDFPGRVDGLGQHGHKGRVQAIMCVMRWRKVATGAWCCRGSRATRSNAWGSAGDWSRTVLFIGREPRKFQKAVDSDTQTRMMMQAAPLVMIQPRFLLPFPIILLDAPAHFDRMDELLERGGFGQIGQEGSRAFGCARRPRARRPWAATGVARLHGRAALPPKARAQAAIRALAPGDDVTGALGQGFGQFVRADRLMGCVALDSYTGPSPGAWGCRHGFKAAPPHLGRLAYTKSLRECRLFKPTTKRRRIAVARIGQHCAPGPCRGRGGVDLPACHQQQVRIAPIGVGHQGVHALRGTHIARIDSGGHRLDALVFPRRYPSARIPPGSLLVPAVTQCLDPFVALPFKSRFRCAFDGSPPFLWIGP